MRAGLTIIVLLGFLIASVAMALFVWRELGDVDISLHGWIALTLGAVATCAVGAGLMALVFFSSRHGYDERANHPGYDDEPR